MIRKLRGFGESSGALERAWGLGVNTLILERVKVSLMESVLVFNITVWFGFLAATNKNRLNRIVRNAGKVIDQT